MDISYLGWTICLLITAQSGLGVARAFSRWQSERELRRLKITRARQDIDKLRPSNPQPKRTDAAWEGFRKFRVRKKVAESRDCHSFYLEPHDGKPLPPYQPGQYLTLQIRLPGEPRPLVRCYSLSDAPCPKHYRCTVKKAAAGDGRVHRGSPSVSGYLNDAVCEGDIVDVKAPRGHFCLDTENIRPVVFIAGGIGVTPLLSMLNTMIQQEQGREAVFILGVRNGREHPFKSHLEGSASRSNVRLCVCYSSPRESDRIGQDYHVHGRISLPVIQELLSSNNYDFYVCGPGEMMQQIASGLQQWGVPRTSVHTEAFGPSSLAVLEGRPKQAVSSPTATNANIRFDKSGRSVAWNPQFESLLDLAESEGIVIESGCRTGSCGTCATAVKSGSVRCVNQPDCETESGVCLLCISTPASDLVLDA
jgi:hypothetical protein